MSPDGKTFTTGGRAGTLAIWRTVTENEVREQSAWFDPRLRLARKCQADARMLQTVERMEDAQQACEQAERIYQELAAEFPDRTDYQASMIRNQDNLARFPATSPGSNQRD